MKKAFVCLMAAVLMTVGASLAFAHHIPMPNLPIGETAIDIRRSYEHCGKVVDYYFLDTRPSEIIVWIVTTLNDKWLLIAHDDLNKIWLVRDLDGHINEYWEDYDAFLKKYPTFCDAVK